jgi:tetratricopeptide (TPR) repeat protein
MWSKLMSRGVLIAGVAFLAMVIIFAAHFDKTQERVAETKVDTTPSEVTPEMVLASADTGLEETSVETPEEQEAEPEPPREVTYSEAEAAYLDRNYKLAVDLFARYTERKTENPWGFYMLGLSAWKAGDNERAETAFERAIEIDPSHVKSYINLGRSLMDAGKPTYALIRVHEALELDPESGVAHRLHGRVNNQLGKVDEAIEAYRRAIQIDNEDAWAINNLALIYIDQGRYDEALPALARAVELRDDIAVFFNNLGMALEHAGQFRAATDAYDRAVSLDGSYDNAFANLTRAANVLEEPGLEAVDLQVAAQSFVDAIAGWGETVVATDTPDSSEPVVDAAPVAEPDTSQTGD